MKVKYDDHYKEEKLFGEPYTELVKFFKNHNPKNTVLDLGCGQGRDAIALAKMGYTVHGVDISVVGLNQLEIYARNNKLNITTSYEDIYTHTFPPTYDIVLLDSMFHFYKKDLERETNLLKKVLTESKEDAVIAIFIQKGKNKEKILKDIIKENATYTILEDKYINYESYNNAQYLMYIIRKEG